jgi:hypothetical protein
MAFPKENFKYKKINSSNIFYFINNFYKEINIILKNLGNLFFQILFFLQRIYKNRKNVSLLRKIFITEKNFYPDSNYFLGLKIENENYISINNIIEKFLFKLKKNLKFHLQNFFFFFK